MSSVEPPAPSGPPKIGRYELLRRIGRGGMASVYLARVSGAEGFARIYALKVLHPHLTGSQELVTMLMDEAKIAARFSHPNIVSTVDLGSADGAYFIVLEYVDGVGLDRLLRKPDEVRPARRIVTIAIDALQGLAAAHSALGEDGEPLQLVHRDVTPGNVIVGVDGVARITDFGIAKARARATKTNPGIVKGKTGFLAPEIALGRPVDARADIFCMGILLWNSLTGESLYDTNNIGKSVQELLSKNVPPPSTVGLRPNPCFDAPILKALQLAPEDRFSSATEMADALSEALLQAGGPPTRREIGGWVETSFSDLLRRRRELADPDVEIREQPAPSPRREDEATRDHRLHKRDNTDEVATTDPHATVPDAFVPDAFVPDAFVPGEEEDEDDHTTDRGRVDADKTVKAPLETEEDLSEQTTTRQRKEDDADRQEEGRGARWDSQSDTTLDPPSVGWRLWLLLICAFAVVGAGVGWYLTTL